MDQVELTACQITRSQPGPLEAGEIAHVGESKSTTKTSETFECLKCIFFNGRSLRGNTFSDLKCLLTKEHFDIISIAETFLNKQTIDLVTEYQLHGFKFFNKDRIARGGGGVAVFRRDYLNPTLQTTPRNNTTEHLSIDLTAGPTILNFNVVYRRPGHSADESKDLYNSLSTTIEGKNSVIVCDFNLPNLNWTNNVGVENESHRLLDFIDDHFMHQLVN